MANRGQGRPRIVQPLTVISTLIGLVAVVTFTLVTVAVHHRTERRLVNTQIREAAATLAAGLPIIQSELDDSLQVARASSSDAFTRFTRARILSQPSYRTVSLWRRAGSTAQLVALAGAAPALVTAGQQAYLDGIEPSDSLHVTGILTIGRESSVGIADMPPGDGGLIAYTETVLPPQRHISVPTSNPFHGIEFALYLNSVRPQNLLEATSAHLGRGTSATAQDPFGDARIIMIGVSAADLSGSLLADLQWIILLVGTLLTVATAITAELLGRRRRTAVNLAAENQRLYLEQRSISSTFQHALLPEVGPLEGFETAARYLPGTVGIEIGGDWYDVIHDGRTCTFVVGDVSGRGLEAAATMASLRFAIRAYIAQGDGPAVIVDKLGRLSEFDRPESFATLLIGRIDPTAGQMTVVNAGHPPPVLLEPAGGWRWLDVQPCAPVGVLREAPTASVVPLPPAATLIAYTDGLVEHRDLPLPEGLNRLHSIRSRPDESVTAMADRIVATLLPGGPIDDTALLVLRWPAGSPAAGPRPESVRELTVSNPTR